MSREEVYEKLTEIFKDVFYRDDITLTDTTSAADIAGWDSLMHITLIGAIEDEFDIKFAMKDMLEMKNVGDMVNIIMGLL